MWVDQVVYIGLWFAFFQCDSIDVLYLYRCFASLVLMLQGDADLSKQASDLLLNKHRIYVQSINYPTVPRGEERLRITPTPGHTSAMMDHLCEALVDVWDTVGIAREEQWLEKATRGEDHGVVGRVKLGEHVEQLVGVVDEASAHAVGERSVIAY